MVADKVEVISREAAEDKTWRWTSDGKTGFELEELTGDAARKTAGTTVLIHFNDEGTQYANSYRLQEIVKKYSNHIAFPIFLTYDKSDWDAEKKESTKTRTTEQVNAGSAMWRRAKSELVDDDYKARYKSISHDWETLLVPHPRRRHARIHHPLLRPRQGPARFLPERLQNRRQALRQARLHHQAFTCRRPTAYRAQSKFLFPDSWVGGAFDGY
jgi:HSP90 family molecular chaperone